ncbi:MAG: trypsin-like peptidase domain-containing protein, partial [Alphaproteobacteria bacterium]|nr:trypsin-like peptidase domain-containing protein [Alphaproteobacteria bacterium]
MHWCLELGRRGRGLTRLAAVLVLLWPLGAAADELVMTDHAGLIRSLLPTVVNITAKAEVADETSAVTAAAAQPGQSYRVMTLAGSGFVVDPAGVIVTNWHVVNGAFEIYVTFSDGTRAKAEVLNAARIVDIALLKVSLGHQLAAVRWGDSEKVQIGDPVFAIGNPLGVGMSVSSGIVSALNRNIMDTPYDDFIQTDAAINHGNSGGPLFDMKGEVIGVNTALISTTTASAGLGFAIPANDARFVVERLQHYGWVRPAWLGVKVQQLTPEMATALGMDDTRSSIVAWVIDGGPAAKAGLKVGDVILRFGGKSPSDERALLRTIAATMPGTPVTITILRKGKQMELPVTLTEWPKTQWEERDAPTRVTAPRWNVPPDLGLTVEPLTDALRAKNELPRGPRGVLVSGVAQDTDAARRGLSIGDVIIQVGDVPVSNEEEMIRENERARAEGRSYAM